MKLIKKYKYHILSFLIPLIVLVSYVLIRRLYSYDLIVSDLREQYIYLFDYFKNILNGKETIFYYFGRGLGGSMYGTFFYYLLSPLNIFLIFANQSNIHLFLIAIMFTKISLCGLTMYHYLSKSNKNKNIINLLFALSYSLMCYNIVNYCQIMWLDVVYFTPLVLLGLDKIIENKKSKGYIIFLFLSILSNYYISYMLCLFLVIYFAFRVFTKYNIKKDKKEIKEIIKKFIISSLLAGFLASFMIFPVLNELKNSYREEVFFDYNLIFNPFNTFLRFSIVESDYYYYLKFFPHIFCGFIPLVVLINYFIKVKDKNKKYIILVFLLFILSFILPILIKFWHGLQMPYHLLHRWSFLFSLFMIIIAAEKYNKIKVLKIKEIIKYSIIYLTFIFLCTVFSSSDKLSIVLLSLNFILFLATFIYLNYVKKEPKNKYIIILFILHIITLFALLFFNFEANFTKNLDIKEFNFLCANRDEIMNKYSSLEKGYYRIGGKLIYTTNETFGIINGRNSLFLSILPKNMIKFYMNTGYPAGINEYADTSNQVALNTLLGTKYWYGETSDDNFELYKEDDPNIYKNKYEFSIGYTINYRKQKLSGSNPFEYQNSIFKSIYGKELWKEYDEDIKEDKDVYFYANNLICDKNEYISVEMGEEGFDFCSNSGIRKVNFNAITDIYTYNNEITSDDLYFYYIEKDELNEMLDYLSKEQINITKIEKNKMNFNIEVEENNTLLLTIPYDKGWSIYVDGKKANYYEILDAFIGLDLDKGKHKVEMVYYPKYLNLGVVLSSINLVLIIIYFKKKKIVIK